MRKTWITIKRGLLEPKHREKLGIRIWLYIYILDHTDWETGILNGWTDKNVADELDMPIRTVKDQRQGLADSGYIECQKTQRGQRIIVHNWTNPREYTGKVYNEKNNESPLDINTSDGDFPLDTPLDTPSTSKSVPSHLIKKSNIIPDNLNTTEFLSAWNLWIKFRKEIKHPLTNSTIGLQLKKLSKYSPEEAVAMINQSIESGYQGLFEIKNYRESPLQHRKKKLVQVEGGNFVEVDING